MTTLVTLSPESVEAVARRVIELQAQAKPSDPNAWLTRAQACEHLGVARETFLRMRAAHPSALRPVSEKPLRWSKAQLDFFKLRGGHIPSRVGTRRQAA